MKEISNFELRTNCLALTPITSKDTDQVYLILTTEFVRKYLCDDAVLPREQIAEFAAYSERSFDEQGHGLWLIRFGEEVIGLVGLCTFFDEDQPQLIYALLPEFVGKGFATEAARRIVVYCFNELSFKYIDASCDEPNLDSHKVADRLGMKLLKTETIGGKPIMFYRIVNDGNKLPVLV